MRSGSTFLGELFNNHDDAFYIFEPLHAFSTSGFSPDSVNERLELLTDNLNCKFKDLYDITIPWKEYSADFDMQQKLDHQGNFIFRPKHRRFCAPPFCVRDVSNNLDQCNSVCGLVDLNLASRICNNLTPVIKIIRFAEIEHFKLMAEENNLDLKERIERLIALGSLASPILSL